MPQHLVCCHILLWFPLSAVISQKTGDERQSASRKAEDERQIASEKTRVVRQIAGGKTGNEGQSIGRATLWVWPEAANIQKGNTQPVNNYPTLTTWNSLTANKGARHRE